MDRPLHGRTILAAINDLMFTSRVRAAGDAAGVTTHFVRTPADLAARAPEADLILLDLETRWLDGSATIRMLKENPATAGIGIVAFASHVLGDALTAAREAGADRVLARSAFVKQLPDLLR
jgi:CheY-like chemotaxis protein